MGSESVRALAASDGIEVVAQIDMGDGMDSVGESGADVVVDFTHPDAVMDNLTWCIDHGVHAVVGTSGFDEDRVARLQERLGPSPTVGILIVPNFSIGAVLMMRFAAQAAPFFESVEIIELHHPDKVDAPSGTATRTAELVAASREAAGLGPVPDATTSDPLAARGADIAGVRVHAVRARGLVASQEILFGGQGETFTLRHDSLHRESFMPGVIAGVRGVGNLRGVTVGLDSVLGLA